MKYYNWKYYNANIVKNKLNYILKIKYFLFGLSIGFYVKNK